MARRASLRLGVSALVMSGWVVSGCDAQLSQKKEEQNPQSHVPLGERTTPQPRLSVTGIPVPDPPVSPWDKCLWIDLKEGLDFGRVPVGERAELPVVVVNACDFDVILTHADLGQLSSSAFSMGEARATPAFIPSGGRQALTVYYEPSRVGQAEGTLVLSVLWANSYVFSTKVSLVGESDQP